MESIVTSLENFEICENGHRCENGSLCVENPYYEGGGYIAIATRSFLALHLKVLVANMRRLSTVPWTRYFLKNLFARTEVNV